MVRGICCVLLAVLPSIVMCNPVKMKMNDEVTIPAVDEFSNFEEGDLLADNKAYFSLSGNTKISLRDNARLWPGGKVPYKIFNKEDDEEAYYLTKAGIDAINKHQCVNFYLDNDPKGDYINIVLGDSLSSHLGHQRNGAQNLTITRQEDWPQLGLNSGSIMHELMHSLGFGHEHNRPDTENFDRDDKVDIKWENLSNGHKEHYFKKYNANGNYSTPVLEYDYNSIMHATSYIDHLAVDKNKAVVTRKNSDKPTDLGQRRKFTDLDIERLKRTYSCGICTGDNEGAIFRYPGDCTQYYECVYDKPMQRPCPANLHINTYENPPYCDYRETARCTEMIDLWN